MDWQVKLIELASSAREWWSELDQNEQYVLVLVTLSAVGYLAQRSAESRMSESVIHLRMEY
jgi:hypothetical protein